MTERLVWAGVPEEKTTFPGVASVIENGNYTLQIEMRAVNPELRDLPEVGVLTVPESAVTGKGHRRYFVLSFESNCFVSISSCRR